MCHEKIWEIQKSEGSEYLIEIQKFLFIEYTRLFGEDIMNAEQCLIFNDSRSAYPMIITSTTPIMIMLAQTSLNYWAQTIFQLSHELCHYVIRQYKSDKDFTLSWLEEIICEAMSLYILKWSAENWHLCNLFNINQSFDESIQSYLMNELNKLGTDELKKCTDIELLREYEFQKSTMRDSHRDERNSLYYEVIKKPEDIKKLCYYTQYVQKNGLTIDFLKWSEKDDSKIIKFLSVIQPVKN